MDLDVIEQELGLERAHEAHLAFSTAWYSAQTAQREKVVSESVRLLGAWFSPGKLESPAAAAILDGLRLNILERSTGPAQCLTHFARAAKELTLTIAG